MSQRGTLRLRDLHWTFPPLAGFLGALGGWCCKWIRRYLLPVTGAALAVAYGIHWGRAIGYAITTAVVFSLGYSPERNPWWQIALIGASYGATPLILSFRWRRAWWPVFTALALAGLLWFSSVAAWWPHKWTETVVFTVHGFLVAWTIDKHRSEKRHA